MAEAAGAECTEYAAKDEHICKNHKRRPNKIRFPGDVVGSRKKKVESDSTPGQRVPHPVDSHQESELGQESHPSRANSSRKCYLNFTSSFISTNV